MSLTISAGQVAAFIANPTNFSGYSAGSYVKIVGAISHTQASQLNAVNATYIEASVSETSIANIAAIAVNNSTRTSLNKFSFVVSDTTATAAALNSVVAKSSVAADFSKITGITASDAASVKALYAATTVGLGSETVSINDTTVNAADLNTINAATDKKITLSATSPTVAGLAADVKTLLVADALNNTQLAGVTAAPITITDSGAVSAADLVAIEANAATGFITVGTGATSLTGTRADITAVLAKDDVATQTALGGGAVVTISGTTPLDLTVTDTNITAAQQKALTVLNTGKITATISDNDATELDKLTGTGHALTIVANDASFPATKLSAYDAVTTLPVTFGTTFATITGTATDIINVLNSSGFGAFPSDLIINVNSGTTSVAQANILDAKTTGVVTATISNGDMASLNTLTGTGNAFTITVTDSTLSSAELVALDAKTTADITINAATTINGTLADAKKVLSLGGATSGIVNATENEVFNITDTVVDTADLAVVATDNATGTSGNVNLTNVTTLTGEGGQIKAAFANAAVKLIPADVAVTIKESGGTIDAQEISDIINSAGIAGGSAALTTGLVTIDPSAYTSGTSTLSGSKVDVEFVLKNSKLVADATADTTGVEAVQVAGLTGLNVTVASSDAMSVAAAEKLTTDYNIGTLEATITGAKVSTFVSDGSTPLTTTGNKFHLTVSGTAADGVFEATDTDDLIELLGKTTGNITLSDGAVGDPKLKGTAAKVASVITNARILNHDSSVVTLSDAAGAVVQAADLKNINAATDKNVAINAGVVLSGAIADVNAALSGKAANTTAATNGIHGMGANNVVITDLVVDHSTLDTLTHNGGTSPLTSGNITVLSNTITGTVVEADDLIDDFASNAKWSGLEDINVTITGTDSTAAHVKTIEGVTTGSVTGALKSDQGIAEVKTAAFNVTNGIRHSFTFATQADETAVSAADLKLVDGMTNGAINASTVTSVTGKAADIISVFSSSGITNLGTSETITITDNPTVSQLNTILGYTTSSVSATIVASMADLNSLTETGNALTISVTGDYTTAELTALSAKTIGTVTTNSGTTLTGTYADVYAAAGAAGFDGATNVTITDAVTTNEIHLLQDRVTSGIVTATISDTDADTLTAAGANIQNAGAFTITVAMTTKPVAGRTAAQQATDAAVTIADLNTLDALTTEVLNVTSGELRGTAPDAVTIFNKNTPDDSTVTKSISGLETIAVNINSGTIDVTELNKIAGKTSGIVTATTDNLAITALVDATTGASKITKSGNAITIKASGNFKASEFITLDGVTTGVVEAIANPATITGSLAEFKTLYATADTTTGVATGTHTIAGIGDAALTLTDTGTVQASDILIVDAFSTGEISVPTTVATIEGTFADVDKAIALEASDGVVDNTITDRAPDGGTPPAYLSTAINITDAVTVAEANKIVKAMTKGVVTATISDTDIATLITTVNNTNQTGLNETTGGAPAAAAHVLTVNVTDTTVTAADINELDTRTAGTVTVSSGTTITGDFTAPTALETALASTGIAGIAKVSSTAAASVAQVNNIIAKSTAVVTATINDKTLAGLATLTGTGNALTIEVDDASADAAAINVINDKTTLAVKVDSTTITGALSDIKTLYDANTAATVSNLGNEVVTISDAGSVAAADLHAVNTLTNGVVSANAVSVVTGSVVDLLKVYSSGNTAGVIAGLGNESIIITDTGTVAASDITTLDGLTSGSITATSVTKLTGSVTEITAARSGATVTGVTSLALTGSTETFDATSYLASNADLITAFGNSPTSAVTHYLAFGVNESRNLDSFDEKSYLASHADLLTAFGSDVTKATAHYISNGFSENRSVDTFDELGYVASYKDLITALGDDANAAVDHYINFGFGENRTSTFDASSYLSANADLSAAFGSDLELAKKHYINHGVNENRALA